MKMFSLRFSFFLLICALLFSCISTKKKHSKYMLKTFTEIKNAFPDAQVKIINDSIKIIFPNNIMFQTGTSEIKPEFGSKIIRLSKILNKYQETNMLVTGHTDDSGTEESNNQLSLKRADNVKDILLKNGVITSRLFTWGLGQKSPIVPNDSEEHRMMNRRVEFVVLYKDN